MTPSNDFVKNFHNMESSIESWRFRTRSLCGLAPPTPYTIYLNVNHSRVPKEITIILQIKYILLIFVTLQSPPPDENHYPLQHRLIGNHWGNSTVKMSCNKCSQLFLTVLLK